MAVSSIRVGKVFGKHEVIVSDGDERLTFIHEATGRRAFGEGAVRAARYIVDKRCGLFGVLDLINENKLY